MGNSQSLFTATGMGIFSLGVFFNRVRVVPKNEIIAKIKLLSEESKKTFVMHRGYHSTHSLTSRPLENTLKAYTKAWDLGMYNCECDIQLTKDNKVILVHNETLHAYLPTATDEKYFTPISALDFVDLPQLAGGATVPLLETVLDEARKRNNAKMVVELKDYSRWKELNIALVQLFVKRPELLKGVNVFMSFQHTALKKFRLDLENAVEKSHLGNLFFLGLTHSRPRSHQIGWAWEEPSAFRSLRQMVKENLFDGIYVRYETGFEKKKIKKQLQEFSKEFVLGIWDPQPDDLGNADKFREVGATFVNTDFNMFKH